MCFHFIWFPQFTYRTSYILYAYVDGTGCTCGTFCSTAVIRLVGGIDMCNGACQPMSFIYQKLSYSVAAIFQPPVHISRTACLLVKIPYEDSTKTYGGSKAQPRLSKPTLFFSSSSSSS